eukprot:3852383-Alexandrium_andersonii.AAC.1
MCIRDRAKLAGVPKVSWGLRVLGAVESFAESLHERLPSGPRRASERVQARSSTGFRTMEREPCTACSRHWQPP